MEKITKEELIRMGFLPKETKETEQKEKHETDRIVQFVANDDGILLNVFEKHGKYGTYYIVTMNRYNIENLLKKNPNGKWITLGILRDRKDREA